MDAPEFLSERVHKIETLIAMVDDELWRVEESVHKRVLSALAYFVDPYDIIPCCFGPDSAKPHREAAARAAVRCVELPLPSLAIDLDHPSDLDAFMQKDGGGRRTRRTDRLRRG